MRKNRNEENSHPSFRPPKDSCIMFCLCPSSHFSKAGADKPVLLKGQRVNILALLTIPFQPKIPSSAIMAAAAGSMDARGCVCVPIKLYF